MTTVAVLADPPRPGLVLPGLTDDGPLTPAEAADLYEAMLRDVCRAVESSGGELLVNYRSEDDVPTAYAGDQSAEAQVRAVVRPALASPDDARFEVQVGSTVAGRVGNTVTHLLETESVTTAAAVEPIAPFLARQTVDNAAMKLRRHDVVLGPAERGRVYYAGFAEPVEFTDAYRPPAVGTLTERAADAGLSTGFLPMQPVVESRNDLVTVVSQLRARRRAGHQVPTETVAYVDELGLDLTETGDGLAVTRA
jgi:hypothetical protein